MNFDMAAFYTNFVRDIRDVQDEKGRITDTVPHIWGSRPADPAWGTAYPLICWYMYQYYGDTPRPRGALRRAQEIRRVPEEHGRERRPQVEPLRRLGGRREVPRRRSSRRSIIIYDVKVLADAARVLGKAAGRRALRQARRRDPDGLQPGVLRPEDGQTTPTGRRRPTPCRSSSTSPRTRSAAGPGAGSSTTSSTSTTPT